MYLQLSQTHHRGRVCTGRNQEAVVIIFGLEALFTRVHTAHSTAVSSLPKTPCCCWLLQGSNQFPILFSFPCGHCKNTVLCKCHHLHSLTVFLYNVFATDHHAFHIETRHPQPSLGDKVLLRVWVRN